MKKLMTTVLALSVAAAPLAAQSATTMEGSVMVQNNRDVPVDVYLDRTPFETWLGTVGPTQIGTLDIPAWQLRDLDHVRLLVTPEGQSTLAADASSDGRGPAIALVVPAFKQEIGLPPMPMAAALPAEDLNAATVTVRNDRKHPSDVLIQTDDMDVRLGSVSAYGMATFRVPDDWVGETGQVVVVPTKGGPLASQHLTLEEGTHLGVHVE